MNQPNNACHSFWLRLVMGLCLLLGILTLSGGLARPAHAASTTTLSVTDCSGEIGPGRIGTVLGNASAGERITFSCSGTIPISSTLTISTTNLTLDGRGQSITLDGGNSTEVLSVNSGVTFTLKALTIAHGFAQDGGGITNNGTLSISTSTFSGNSADPNGGGVGGGLLNYGTLSISTSTFSANFGDNGGGGLLNEGGTVTISTSTFSSNSAFIGGGLLNEGGTATISDSTFSSNSADATQFGGGLLNYGTLMITNITISGNSAGVGGGLENDGTMTVSTSTIAANSGIDYSGGINNYGMLTVSTSTISGNSVSSQGAGGLSNNYGGTVNMSGSIVAENTGGDCTTSNGGVVTDNGYNLSSDSSCGFTATTSKQNTNPQLGPLTNNGGPTQTMALLKGSPAIDAIPLASGLCPKTDQRGHKRPDNTQESACDIGAFES